MSAQVAMGLAVKCFACGKDSLSLFYEVKGVPAQSCVLLDDAEEARAYPLGDIALQLCDTCGFIQNGLFEQALVDYSVPTEESQAYSPRFREFSSRLAQDLWERHELPEKAVLEIGCGKGDFLVELASLGVGSAVGIDPGFAPRTSESAARVRFIRDWYGEQYADLSGDLVVARHLLEHIPDVADFTRLMIKSLNPNGSLFVEVPDTTRVLSEGAFWDVYYEHCSYFTERSLRALLDRVGLRVDRCELAFDDQYLLAEASFGDGNEMAESAWPEDLSESVRRFGRNVEAAIGRWTDRFARLSDTGRTAALWGGGSKAIAFLSSIDAGGCPLEVVDINPHKQGRFLPGSGIEVQAPVALAASQPDLVVVMNPIYSKEICQSLSEMGAETEVLSVTD